MAWIESHQAIERHPKTLKLMSLMEWDLDTTVGKLHRFWWWCVDYAEDGDLRKHNDAILGGAVALNGSLASCFVEAMVTACWLDREPYFRVHDWWNYIGRFLQVKYKAKPEKWQVVRAAYANNPPNNPPNNHKPNQPNQPKQNPAREHQDFPTNMPRCFDARSPEWQWEIEQARLKARQAEYSDSEITAAFADIKGRTITGRIWNYLRTVLIANRESVNGAKRAARPKLKPVHYVEIPPGLEVHD